MFSTSFFTVVLSDIFISILHKCEVFVFFKAYYSTNMVYFVSFEKYNICKYI